MYKDVRAYQLQVNEKYLKVIQYKVAIVEIVIVFDSQPGMSYRSHVTEIH